MAKRVLYVHGDGGLWRLTPKQRAAVAAGAAFYRVGRKLAATKNFRTGRWQKLPTSIAQDAEGNLYIVVNGADLVSYDEIWSEL
tara:strand:+ start:957 stop:1208 length:252 start_codon:yes stop_codon:yes gene_type:complete